MCVGAGVGSEHVAAGGHKIEQQDAHDEEGRQGVESVWIR